MNDIQGAMIEIVERRKRPDQDSLGASLVVPNEVRLNGQRLAMPDDAPIVINEIAAHDVVKVTLTLFARRIFVGHEDVDDAVLRSVDDATSALVDAQRQLVDANRQLGEAVIAARQDLAAANRHLSDATSAESDVPA